MSATEFANTNPRPNHVSIETSLDPTLLCDDLGIIVKANGRARAFFGNEEFQYSGVPVRWIIPAKSRDHFLLDWDRRSLSRWPSGLERSPLMVRNSIGQSAPIWLTIDEVKSYGRSQFILIFKDASTTATRNTLDEAGVSQYLSSLRHQIRNLLSGIKMFSDVLLRDKPGNLVEKQIDYLEGIRDAVARVSALVDEIDVPKRGTGGHGISELERPKHPRAAQLKLSK